ncbi:5' exonuclease Apollo [Linum grandiflorum]
MPIEMPRGLPFSVDTWSARSKAKRHHFLTHAHKDHSSGILSCSSYPIYCTNLTKSLLLNQYPQLDESMFVSIEVGQSILIDDPYGEFTVAAFDANHCPGAVMFLFEGNFGNILHTGDCRLTPECLYCLPDKYISKKEKQPTQRLDYVFLDCTFGKFRYPLPSKRSSIQQVINCIWKHPEAIMVYLTCDMLGQEDILADVSRAFGSKIFVDSAANPECFGALSLTVPEILTKEASSRFHVFDGFPNLYKRAATKLAEAEANSQPEPLIVRASAQWYACDEEYSCTGSEGKLRFDTAVKDQFGVWHICYSMHSSREELEWALQLLAPRWVASTTPECPAMELDYVKKHCLASRLTASDPIWKLLDISVDITSSEDISTQGAAHNPMIEQPALVLVQSPQKLKNGSARLSYNLPLSDGPTVTLFGRARLRIEESFFLPAEIVQPRGDKCAQVVPDDVDKELKVEKVVEKKNEMEEVNQVEINVTEGHLEEQTKDASSSSCANVRSFGDNLKRYYRSMNVPVPRPLPSLVKLLDNDRRKKRRFES